jgi:hypothetical protein
METQGIKKTLYAINERSSKKKKGTLDSYQPTVEIREQVSQEG